MSDPATLTPPADAPLPWTLDDEGYDEAEILDATGNRIIEILSLRADVGPYLVACANAAPGMVAERDAAVAELEKLRGCDPAVRIAVRLLSEQRDTALARVAELEARLAKQAPVIDGVRKNAANDVQWYGRNTRSWATDMVALLDKETP